MSYAISRFIVKSIDLVLPIGFSMVDFTVQQQKHTPPVDICVQSNLKDWSYKKDGEGIRMAGVVTEEGLKVTLLECRGEGSGHDYHQLVKPLFARFKGNLEAVLVWKPGIPIEKVTILQGVVSEEEVSL